MTGITRIYIVCQLKNRIYNNVYKFGSTEICLRIRKTLEVGYTLTNKKTAQRAIVTDPKMVVEHRNSQSERKERANKGGARV